jgi:type VI secretion system protein ImpC
VIEDPSKPGVYKAIARLRPHFQLDEITISLRLVARLPAAKG